jgi:hypothetical protein
MAVLRGGFFHEDCMTEVVTETPNETPVENVLAEVVEPVETPVAESEVVAETPETPKEDVEAEDKRKNPWFLKRISAEAEARRAAEAERDNYKAMLERTQTKTETPPPPPPQSTSPDFQTAVQREAARMRLAEDSTAIRDAGYRAYGQEFGQTLAVLNAAGAVSDDIVMDLIAVDKENAHKILATLAQDPEQATQLATMDSRRRTVALTRLAMAQNTTTAAPKAATPAPKQVSKAPAPPPSIEPSAKKVVDWRNAETEAEFQAGWLENMKNRKAVR